jgi:hypothetical protein
MKTISALNSFTPATAAANTKIATPQPLGDVVGNKSLAPATSLQLGQARLPGSLDQNTPGMGKNGLGAGVSKDALGGSLGLGSLGSGDVIGGLGKNGPFGGLGDGILGPGGKGLPGTGGFGGPGSEDGLSGLSGFLGGFGGRGPSLKMPGSDRMDGDFSGGFFGKGTWDYGPKGLTGSGSGGVTVGGYGIGVNDRGQLGVATGDAYGGNVTSPGDAKKGANSAVGGGGKPASGVPEGLDWSRGTGIKEGSTTTATPDSSGTKTEGPNDLGPSTNEPEQPKEDENQTAVASNDDIKDNQAGKPNPMAMPNPEDSSGGGSPRASIAYSSFFMPNPEDSGGGTPRSNSLLGSLYMPNPEDSGGGTPRSVSASVATTASALNLVSIAGVSLKLRV